MFTLGIFTTHLPYIALVMFYAFFWMIGVDKEAGEKISSSNSSLTLLQINEHHEALSDYDYCFKNDNYDSGHFFTVSSACFEPLKKLIHNGYYLIKHSDSTFKGTLFSRPPPVIL